VLGQRPDYAVVAVDRVIVKLLGPNPPHWVTAAALERAPYLARQLRGLGVPVPEVLAVDTSCREWPVRYVISGALPGVSLATVLRAELNTVFAELGMAVARVHGLVFPEFGELGADGGVIEGAPDYAEALTQRAQRRLASTRYLELFRELVERYRPVLGDSGPPALTHEDLNPYNLLVQQAEDGWHLSGILDWDAAWAGCPDSDLARLSVWHRMHPRSFWSAYQAVRPITAAFEQRKPLLALLWCLEYASPTDDHHAVTAKVCAQLGIPPIRFDQEAMRLDLLCK
jgi:Ser/Thr protein kinase RdoA (MazF antagonist)